MNDGISLLPALSYHARPIVQAMEALSGGNDAAVLAAASVAVGRIGTSETTATERAEISREAGTVLERVYPIFEEHTTQTLLVVLAVLLSSTANQYHAVICEEDEEMDK